MDHLRDSDSDRDHARDRDRDIDHRRDRDRDHDRDHAPVRDSTDDLDSDPFIVTRSNRITATTLSLLH